jgi:nucleoside-diphosphate-sugar epimerase
MTGVEPQNEIIEISGEEFYGSGYEDTNRVVPDISKMQSLGWNPTRDLETTFRSTMESYRGASIPAGS